MKVGITDSKGRLGKVLHQWYPRINLMDAHEYDVIIHNGAYTDVNGAETNIVDAVTKNIYLTQRLRNSTKAKIIYLSTDFVFDGNTGPYHENDKSNPISVYGWTKWLGERVLNDDDCIVRTTVLYGGHKPDFVRWVLAQLDRDHPFEVTSRLITTPTYVYHLAEALQELAQRDKSPNIVNIVGDTVLSRYAFAIMIANTFNKNPALISYSTETEFGAAQRPQRAGLKTNVAKSIGLPIYSVQNGLLEMRYTNEN